MATNESGRVNDSDDGRYASLSLGTDEFVIYDRENHQAWVQSALAFPLENIR